MTNVPRYKQKNSANHSESTTQANDTVVSERAVELALQQAEQRKNEYESKLRELAKKEAAFLQLTQEQRNFSSNSSQPLNPQIPKKLITVSENFSGISQPATSQLAPKISRSRNRSGNGTSARHNSPAKEPLQRPRESTSEWLLSQGTAIDYEKITNFESRDKADEQNGVFNDDTSSTLNPPQLNRSTMRSHSQSCPPHPALNLTHSSTFAELELTDQGDTSALKNAGTPNKEPSSRPRKNSKATPRKSEKRKSQCNDAGISGANIIRKNKSNRKKQKHATDSESDNQSTSLVSQLRDKFANEFSKNRQNGESESSKNNLVYNTVPKIQTIATKPDPAESSTEQPITSPANIFQSESLKPVEIPAEGLQQPKLSTPGTRMLRSHSQHSDKSTNQNTPAPLDSCDDFWPNI